MDATTAFRAAALLDSCGQDLRKGVSIPGATLVLIEHRDELVAYVNDQELTSLLQEQKRLEERKNYLSNKRPELKGLPKKKEYTLVEAELHHTVTKLSSNEKRLCAKLLKHPLIASNIEKMHESTSEIGNLFTDASRELREHGTFVALQDRSLASFRQRRDEMASKAKRTKESVCKLRETMQSAKRYHDERVGTLESETHQVTLELSHLRDGTCESSNLHRSEMEEKVVSTKREFEQNERAAKMEIDKLHRLIRKAKRDHKEKVEQTQQDIEELEAETEEEKRRRAEEADAKDAELASVASKRQTNLNSLVDLQRRWDRDEAEAKRAEDKREEDRQKRLEQEEELHQQRLAVARIQIAYRICLKRRAKKAANSKAKKKPKKGKGKKK